MAEALGANGACGLLARQALECCGGASLTPHALGMGLEYYLGEGGVCVCAPPIPYEAITQRPLTDRAVYEAIPFHLLVSGARLALSFTLSV